MNSSCTSYFYCSSWFCQSWMPFPEVPLLGSVLVEPQPQNFSPSWFHKRLFLGCVPTQLSCIRTRFWCCTCTWSASVQACCIAEGCEGKVKDHTCKKAWVVPPPFMQKFSLRVVTDSAFGWLLFKCKNALFFFFFLPWLCKPKEGLLWSAVHHTPKCSWLHELSLQGALQTRDSAPQLSSRVHLPQGGCDGVASQIPVANKGSHPMQDQSSAPHTSLGSHRSQN